jgi:dipeptidyl aminopeptidase/acylaminoacyl peptidase
MIIRLSVTVLLGAAIFLGAPAGAAEAIKPSENLVLEGLPPIPASLPDEVRRYTEARSALFAGWHPVKREMLISTRFGNTNQIHRVAAPGAARTQMTFFAEPVRTAEYDHGAGRYFLFTKDTGGNEFMQIFRLDLAGGRSTMLTDGGRSQNSGWQWAHAKDRIVYGSTRRNGADRDLWVMDPAAPKSDELLLQVKGGGWHAADWSPDDKKIVAIEQISASKSNLWLVEVASGTRAPLSDPGEHVSYTDAKFSADGRGLYVSSDKDSEFQRLGYFDLATKALTPLTVELSWDVEEFDLSPDRKTIAFTTNEAGISKLHFLDTSSREVSAAPGVPAGVMLGLRWHPQGQEVGFTLGSARSSADAYSYKPAGAVLSRWTESELGGLVAEELSEPVLIHWKSFDGREISGFLYRPPARFTGRRPVIIDIHGGPEGQSRPLFLARDNYLLNELGVALILPNVRGSVGYGKSFEKLDNGPRREDAVRDIGALLDHLATQPELDASRVMVTGGSYGGYMSLAVATHYNDRLRCAVDIVGISHFGTFLKNTESYRRELRRVEYGDETDPAMAAFFEKIAPLNRADKITKPLFVIQGGNDPRVPASEAAQMVERIKKNGTPVWYLLAKDEGHGFQKKTNRDFMFFAQVEFVKRFLLGD